MFLRKTIIQKAEKKANELYNQVFNDEIAIMLEKYCTEIMDVARYLGIKVIEVNFEKELSGKGELLDKIQNDKVSGIFSPERKIILVNNAESVFRRRFTIAHELGHYVLGHKTKGNLSYVYRDKISSAGINDDEIAANAFAAELLMPRKLVVSLFKKFKHTLTVADLTKIFAVSEIAMKNRLITLVEDIRNA